ncbi:MAG: glycosyltransferase, partial [Pseudomonadota bacterium]|nr:glycosyltransferase [Pseudomonadota bacterium]
MRAQPLDVSVVIPAYRAEHTIARALNSVIAQSKPPREVIVVIDGSPDNTGSVAEIFCDKFQDTKYTVIHQENAGAGAARNLA